MTAADGRAGRPPGPWPAFELLADVPTLVIRGALSDILEPETVRQMLRHKPDLKIVEVEKVGHAPVLDEPPAVEAIKTFLADLPTK